MRALALFFSVIQCMLLKRTRGELTRGGSCPLYIFVPFSADGETGDESKDSLSNEGVSFLTAAMLAIEDFNNRNATAVPELANLERCPVKFPLPDVTLAGFVSATLGTVISQVSRVIDSTLLSTTKAATTFKSKLPEVPCAAVGPAYDESGLALSGLATAFEFPLILQRSFDFHTVDPDYYPNTLSTYPGISPLVFQLADTLLKLGRDNFVVHIYPQTLAGLQLREAVGLSLQYHNISQSASFGIFPGSLEVDSRREAPIDQGEIQIAQDFDEVIDEFPPAITILEEVRRTGYRTIILSLADPTNELKPFAELANGAGLTNGDYLWVLIGEFDFDLISQEKIDEDIEQLLRGSILIQPAELWRFQEDRGFHNRWRNIDDDFIQIMNRAYDAGLPNGHLVAGLTADSYKGRDPHPASGYMYDSVLAAGFSACAAFEISGFQYNFTVQDHVQGLLATTFQGATGNVSFSTIGRGEPNSLFAVLNLLPPGSDQRVSYVNLKRGDNETLSSRSSNVGLVFADGRDVAPDLLRDLPEQNFLGESFRIVGFCLVGIVFFSSSFSVVWVYIYKEHKVIRAAQPLFLYLLCLGAAVMGASIIPLSFDESYGLSESALSRNCMCIPWLFAIGYVISYSALFMKLWRVQRVLSFARRKVNVTQVLWPFVVVMILGIVVLSAWTAIDPLRWERREIDSTTGESIGGCHSEHIFSFLTPLILVMIIPDVLTTYMAYKTRDVDDIYSEHSWIQVMSIVQFEVILLAAPLTGLLRDLDVNARYMSFSFLIFTLPISVVGFIVGPKFFLVHRPKERTSGRGTIATGQVRVTGLPQTPNGSNPSPNVSLSSPHVKFSAQAVSSITTATPHASQASQTHSDRVEESAEEGRLSMEEDK